MSEDDQRTKNRTAAVFQGKDLEEDSDTAAVTISYPELAFSSQTLIGDMLTLKTLVFRKCVWESHYWVSEVR